MMIMLIFIIALRLIHLSKLLIRLFLLVMILLVMPFFFFFFQAEDGIRDTSVTGVQTCALPISTRGRAPERQVVERARLVQKRATQRSEERRVGKECRSRWSSHHLKKNIRHLI